MFENQSNVCGTMLCCQVQESVSTCIDIVQAALPFKVEVYESVLIIGDDAIHESTHHAIVFGLNLIFAQLVCQIDTRF